MLAVVTIVFRGDVRRDHFALRRGQCVWSTQERFGEFQQGFRAVGAECERTDNPRQTFWELNMSRKNLSPSRHKITIQGVRCGLRPENLRSQARSLDPASHLGERSVP
jgi:hypothetical protein